MKQQTERDALIARLRSSGPSCNISGDVSDAVKLLDAQAQRIAELEQGLKYAKADLTRLHTTGAIVCNERDSLRAELEALRGQEPVGWQHQMRPGVWFEIDAKNYPRAACPKLWEGARKIYAAPVAPAHPANNRADDGFEIWWADFAPTLNQADAIDAWNAAQPSQDVNAELTDEQIMNIAKPFIRSVGGYTQHEDAIPDSGAIEDFSRALLDKAAQQKGQA
jgi:hypothetical protein